MSAFWRTFLHRGCSQTLAEVKNLIQEGAAEGITDENEKTKKIIDLEGNKKSNAAIYSK